VLTVNPGKVKGSGLTRGKLSLLIRCFHHLEYRNLESRITWAHRVPLTLNASHSGSTRVGRAVPPAERAKGSGLTPRVNPGLLSGPPLTRSPCPAGPAEGPIQEGAPSPSYFSLYKILQLPIVCGIYCNNGGSGGNVILRNSAGGDGVGWGTYTKGGCAKDSIDSCTKTQTQNNILYRRIPTDPPPWPCPLTLAHAQTILYTSN